MSLHYFSQDNSRNANHWHISLTGTDHCNSKLSKNIKLLPSNISENIFRKIKFPSWYFESTVYLLYFYLILAWLELDSNRIVPWRFYAKKLLLKISKIDRKDLIWSLFLVKLLKKREKEIFLWKIRPCHKCFSVISANTFSWTYLFSFCIVFYFLEMVNFKQGSEWKCTLACNSKKGSSSQFFFFNFEKYLSSNTS